MSSSAVVPAGRFSRTTSRRALLVGILISSIGSNMAGIAMDLHAAVTHSSLFLMGVLIAQSVPAVLLGLIGGVVADRRLTWWWWPASLVAQAATWGSLAFISRSEILLAGVALSSSVSALIGPVASKMVRQLADDKAKTAGHMAGLMGISQAVGVAFGAIGFEQVGMKRLLLMDGASFLVLGAVAMLTVSPGSITLDGTSERGFLLGFRRMAAGHVFGRSGVQLVWITICGTSIEAVTGIFVLTQRVHASYTVVGLAQAAWGLGVIAGGNLTSRIKGNPHWAMCAAASAMGVSIMAVALLLPPGPLVIALFAFGGVANGLFNGKLVHIIMREIPGHEQGRVWAAFRWLSSTAFLSGYVVGGLFGASRAQIGMATSGLIVVASALLAVIRRRSTMDGD